MVSLADVFDSVAVKTLASVDLPDGESNQHELNGVRVIREFFGTTERVRGTIHFHLYRDGLDSEHESTTFTFYDSRENQPRRSPEWRMYYRGEFLAKAVPGDVIVLARTREGEFHGFVFTRESGWLAAARHLFGFGEDLDQFRLLPAESLSSAGLELARRRILEELGFDVALQVSTDFAALARSLLVKHGGLFPTTRIMAETAWSFVRVDLSDPDRTMCFWLDAEEQLFYGIESELLGEKLAKGFSAVDDFISVAQTTLQRRKSRMGHSLQHHAAEIFRLCGLRFSPQTRTERKNQPDFIFPGKAEYLDESFPEESLTMLAVKSTCKDRWRQILTEADRIPRKHLLTLDQSLSNDQMNEMGQSRVQLVVPTPLQVGYKLTLREHFLSLAQFIENVRRVQ